MTDLEKIAAGAVESAVLGPDDVLVLSFDRDMTPDEFERIGNAITEFHSGMRGRILLVAGAKVLVAHDAAKAVDQ